jgi:hypothetical protein
VYTNVNLAAPVGVLALLGSGFLLVVFGVAFLASLVTRKPRLTKLSLLGTGLIIVSYLAVLLVFSFASKQIALSPGQEKHFCEIDCHLAYSIVAVNQTKVIGRAPALATATGTYRVVTIKTRFDETTIGSNRGNGLLYPNPRRVMVVDENGREFFPSPEGQHALAQAQDAGTAITTPLRPGESYTSTVVFDLPADVRNPVLLINEADWLTRFVIGHENSVGHRKTTFQI